MAFTVADCMNLPSLREAKLVGGGGGLLNSVTSASVLEYAKASVIKANIGLVMKGEIVVTAMVGAKDSVDEQVEIIRCLHMAACPGIVLYYVGMVLPQVDPRLICLADELNFPILCMPTNHYQGRYADAMGDIFEAIFKRKFQQGSLVNVMLDRLSKLDGNKRNFNTMLKMLGEHVSCSLILMDYAFSSVAVAARPCDSAIKPLEVMRRFMELQSEEKEAWMALPFENSECYACYVPIIFDKSLWMHLVAFHCEGERAQAPDIADVGELVRLFINIWKADVFHEKLNNVVHYIFQNETAQLKQLLKKQKLYIADIRIMWVIRGDFDSVPADKVQAMQSQIIMKATSLLKKKRKPIVTNIYNGDIILMMAETTHKELDSDIEDTFVQWLLTLDPSISLIAFNDCDSAEALRDKYKTYGALYQAMRKIYPIRAYYTSQELRFSQICRKLAIQTEPGAAKEYDPLKSLRVLLDGDDLINTLAVFCLDAKCSTQAAANQLFVHKNTIKYRLQKVQKQLGYDIWQVPASVNLHIALGVHRLS